MVNSFNFVKSESFQAFRDRIDTLTRTARDRAALVRVGARVGFRSGLSFDMNGKGLAALIQARLKGSLGWAGLFRIHAKNTPDAPAIVSGGRSFTYAEVDARIDRVGSRLRNDYGMQRGQSAMLFMHNKGEFIEIQAALTRIGCAAVSASWRSKPDELAYLVDHSGTKVLFIEAELAPMVLEAREKFSHLPETNIITVGGRHEGLPCYDDLVAAGYHAPVQEASAEDAAVVVYTSGTTGKPKGAVRRFTNESQLAFIQVVDELDLRHDDRHLAVCPLYHTTAFGFVSFTFIVGGTVYVEPKFEPERMLQRIHEDRITTAAVVPTMLHRLLELPVEVRRKYDTRSLRAVFTAGAPLSGALARDFIREFGHILYNIYGATETGLNTIATPEELLMSPGTIGHVVQGNEVRILHRETGEELPQGETGELFIRNAMLVSYHRNAEATEKSMKSGFFSVGDLAHFDSNNLLHIDGRVRDMFISGGVNVYPAEIEETFSHHPQLAEVAVIGVSDPEWGEKARLFVVPRQGEELDIESLVAWGKERLSGPKAPRDIRVLDDLPKNPTGKVLKRELRDMIA